MNPKSVYNTRCALTYRAGNTTGTLEAQFPSDAAEGCYVACLQREPPGTEYHFCADDAPFVLIGNGTTFAHCKGPLQKSPRRLAPGQSGELYVAVGVVGDLVFPSCDTCVPMDTGGAAGTLFLVLVPRPDGALRVAYANVLLASNGAVYLSDMQPSISGAMVSGSLAGGALC